LNAFRCEMQEKAKEKIARNEPINELDALALEAAKQNSTAGLTKMIGLTQKSDVVCSL
uniref:Elongation factor Ts n=1 Tax=Toxocara canis TaxID=6265 RepID=A0A183VH19_TOXCA